MKILLKQTLSKIAEKAEDCNENFDLADRIIAEYGEKNLASRLYRDIDQSIDWQAIANLFSTLEWSTSDNGTELSRETNQWLKEANDERKINIAMNLTTYPFLEFQEMVEVLKHIAENFPCLKVSCEEMIRKRRKIGT